MSYRAFAEFYDCFTSDVGYDVRSGYLLNLFLKFDKKPALLLDIGCGTGGFSFALADRGIEVIGIDPSAEMLSLAREKDCEGPKPLFLQQSAESLDLYGTVDGAVACLDTLNHIVKKAELARSLARISLFLEPGCLFIFDVNTLYKHKKVLSHRTFSYDNGEKLCIWKNSRCSKNGTVKMKLKLYQNTDGGYWYDTDRHAERAYSAEEWQQLLTEAGFQIEAVYADGTTDPPTETTERVYYVTRKKKEHDLFFK